MSDEIIGGLLTGLGSGIIDNHRRKREDAIARRQEFLEDARAARMRTEAVQDRDFKATAEYAQLEAQLAAAREENKKNRKTQIEIAELQSRLPGRGHGGDAPTLQEIQKRREEVKLLIGTGMRMNDPLDNNPEKSKNFVKAVSTALELTDSGYPMHKVAQVAIEAAKERPLPIKEAKEMARKQLSSWLPDLFRGSAYQEEINKLAKELMIESRLYRIRLRQMRASANDHANMPSGIGTEESPLMIENDQNREWLNKYQLPGQYFKFRNEVHRVPQPGSAYGSSSQ